MQIVSRWAVERGIGGAAELTKLIDSSKIPSSPETQQHLTFNPWMIELRSIAVPVAYELELQKERKGCSLTCKEGEWDQTHDDGRCRELERIVDP